MPTELFFLAGAGLLGHSIYRFVHLLSIVYPGSLILEFSIGGLMILVGIARAGTR